ncbi:type I polyketide synthase [Rhabdochromatium marinum]|uniref:type I polyketide synthase n=1 Tax=Rhabdochromatium marinum TaxID=48729 RepID=UPI001907DB54|nr:type I polyketide synthase [Rhabdochromatium marinum]MBK1647698.1 hypothetical protein [Rhabdochromatium marinum]
MSAAAHQDQDVAIIGLSGLFPGSATVEHFWNNILAGRDLVQEAPDTWAQPWYDPDGPDLGMDSARIRTRKVGLLGDLAVFDPFAFGIPPKAVEGDPAHYMALQLAGDALQDAGYQERSFNRERTGVIVGRGSSPNRGDVLGMQYGLVIDQTLDLLSTLMPDIDHQRREVLRAALKRSLPQVETEHAPTLISNVISGRISNRLDLMGPSYLVDSACSSSLIALDLGVRDLNSGRCDMVLVGGIQASMPAQIYMLFQQIGALAAGDIRPFDASASGTLLGEGAGFAVIKRLADAVRDDDQIYAVIKGVGVASDGKAMGLLAPRLEGEALAIRRAYEQTGIAPASIRLIEAHGTGIPLGDRTEIQALNQIFGARRGHLPDCAIGSVKSMIGHCIPAAGMASLIKTSLALHHKILPPTLCGEVSPELGLERTPFYVNTRTRPWVQGGDCPRRAGINAFGFGGINTHAILEEDRPPTALPPPGLGRWLLRDSQRAAARLAAGPMVKAGTGSWPSELLVFASASRAALLDQIGDLLARLSTEPDEARQETSHTTLGELAAQCWREQGTGPIRLAVVASDLADLRAKLALLRDKLPGLFASKKQRPSLSTRKGLFYAEIAPEAESETESEAKPETKAAPSKIAWLFSSEGAQYPNMLADLAVHLPQVRRWFDFLDDIFPRDPRPSAQLFPAPTTLDPAARDWLHAQLHAGDLATESISMASHALYELLRDLGIPCDAMIGHSAGEHVALRASGLARTTSMEGFRDQLRALNQLYQQMEEQGLLATGRLISIGALDDAALAALLRERHDHLYLVADNCANQAIVFVEESQYQALQAQLQALGAIHAELPFDRAYHTPLFASGAAAIRAFYAEQIETSAAEVPVYSCSTAAPYPSAGGPASLDIAAEQWTKPVRFRDTIEALYRDGVRVFIEVGANSSLTAFVDSILKGRDALTVASNVQDRPALEQLQHLLGQLFVRGIALDLEPLFAERIASKAVGAAANRRRQYPQLKLSGELPHLSLDAETVQQQHDWLASNRTTAVPPPAEALQNEAPLRQEIVMQHFRLMQAFLDSQSRMASLLTQQTDNQAANQSAKDAPDRSHQSRNSTKVKVP